MTDEQDRPIRYVRQVTDPVIEALNRIREDVDAVQREHKQLLKALEQERSR